MSTLTTDEKELAITLANLNRQLQALSDTVTELSGKVKTPEDEDNEFTPGTRCAITLTAQFGGFFLLWLLGSNTFSLESVIRQPDIRRGLEYINEAERFYMWGSVALVVILLSILIYRRRDPLEHKYIDILLLSFVIWDLILLLFLVCQEGGLCRSMFLPVYFLIPTAYLTAERHAKKYRWRKLIVLFLILLCIYISYRYAAWAQPAQSGSNLQPTTGTFYLFWRWQPVAITDFSTLAHRDYDEAVWYASCISALVPIIQIASLIFLDHLKKIRVKPTPPSPDAQAAENV